MRKIVALISSALLIGLFFGFLWGHSSLIPSGSLSTSQPSAVSSQRASLMIDYGNGMVRVYPDIAVAPGETMLQLLEKQTAIATLELRTKEFSGLGRLVERIGEMENGDGGKYWQYWVNNVSIPYAADKYVVRAGDVIEWKFLKYK